jgi:hypothetical protein
VEQLKRNRRATAISGRLRLIDRGESTMTGEPTLRLGDHEQDGWVKYAQQLLQPYADYKLVEDGIFGNATYHAVRKFQHYMGLQVDGTIGNQTWASLRADDPAAVGTDGLKPHTHLDQGPHLVWEIDGGTHGSSMYFVNGDEVSWLAVNVGGQPVKPGVYSATLQVIDDKNHAAVSLPLDLPYGEEGDVQPGGQLVARLSQAKATYGEGKHRYTITLPAELGGQVQDGEFDLSDM